MTSGRGFWHLRLKREGMEWQEDLAIIIRDILKYA